MERQGTGETFFVGEIKAQRSDGNPVVLDCPAVGSFLCSLKGRNSEPVNWTAHWILARDHFSVVLPHRLARPANASWLWRQIHVDERHRFFIKKQLEHFRYLRLKRQEIWFLFISEFCASGYCAPAE